MFVSNEKKNKKELIFANVRLAILFVLYIAFIDKIFFQNMFGNLHRLDLTGIENLLNSIINFSKFALLNTSIPIHMGLLVFILAIVTFILCVTIIFLFRKYSYTLPSSSITLRSETVESGKDIYKLTSKFIC